MITVYIWEMDSFSGRKLDSTKEFESREEAHRFVSSFNSENTDDTTPDWYMYASIGD